MRFNIVKSIKLFLLKKLSGWMLAVTSMIIRKAYTNILRGIDANLDTHIRFISVNSLYDIDLQKVEKIEIDQEKIREINLKIDENTKTKIEFIKIKHSEYIETIKTISSNVNGEFDNELEIDLSLIETAHLRVHKLIYSIFLLILKFNKEKRYFSDLNAYKLDIKYDQVIKLITITTPILLIGGILKQFILSKIYNFELSIVFTFSDYISASIDTLIYSIFPIAIFIISSFWNYHEETRLDPLQQKWGLNRQKIMIYIVFISILGSTIIFYFRDLRIFYSIFPASILILSMLFLPDLINRYFKNRFSAFAFLFLTINFFSNIFSSTMLNSYIVSSKDDNNKYSYVFDNNIDNVSNLKIITTGTHFTVFWDYDKSCTVLVKSGTINKIFIKKDSIPERK